uniref:Uncharacterized protein n=1 Tax=Romanomermis culicivorax TaxID=13658 RepID=A0A915JJI0_ROMCU
MHGDTFLSFEDYFLERYQKNKQIQQKSAQLKSQIVSRLSKLARDVCQSVSNILATKWARLCLFMITDSGTFDTKVLIKYIIVAYSALFESRRIAIIWIPTIRNVLFFQRSVKIDVVLVIADISVDGQPIQTEPRETGHRPIGVDHIYVVQTRDDVTCESQQGGVAYDAGFYDHVQKLIPNSWDKQ